MKIAFFTDTYDPQVNGVVTSIKIFRKELEKLGHKVYIICPDGRGKKEKNVIRLPSFKFKPYPEYRGGVPVPGLLAKIKKINPDVIHVQSPASIGFTGMLIAKSLGIPLVMTYHTLLEEYFKYFLLSLRGKKKIEKFSEKLMKKYTGFFYNRANVVIAPSTEVETLLRSCGVTSRIEVIPTGIDFSPKKLKRKPLVVYAGRLGKEKNVDLILKAFSIVERETQAELMVIGEGPERKNLENLAESLGLKNVTFTGYLERNALREIFSAASVFVCASTTETQGLSVLEALSCGCPVVVPGALGLKDFVTHGTNGLFFKPGSRTDLARKIISLLTDSALRRKLSKGAAQTGKSFRASKCAKRLEAVYLSLVEPLVSVVIPAFNEEKYIEKTLRSVVGQNYTRTEIIVVDNGSTDRTSEIAKKYARVVRERKRGISIARNTGFRHSRGDIVLFLDADTRLERNFISSVVERFKNKDVIGVCGYIETTGKRTNRILYLLCSELAWISSKLGFPLFYGMCMAWRREVFSELGGFDESLKTAEDIDLTMKARKLGKCVLAREAKALTSPRRVEGMGFYPAVKFHIKNFFKHLIYKKPERFYEVIR
ncbi:MAG: glycosyltransferase [Candidatus Micrarchaeota archaeon]|nr:glycosyltransferase [Candidatus Micrarchaeota archaeon]